MFIMKRGLLVQEVSKIQDQNCNQNCLPKLQKQKRSLGTLWVKMVKLMESKLDTISHELRDLSTCIKIVENIMIRLNKESHIRGPHAFCIRGSS